MVAFVRENPAEGGFDRMNRRLWTSADRLEQQGIDDALRRGLSGVFAGGGAEIPRQAGAATPPGAQQGGGQPPAAASPARVGAPPAAAPAGQAAPTSGRSRTVPANLVPAFEAASRETGIPLSILLAQARTESAFDPNARGAADEIGIMQIMPSTARQPGFGVAGVDPAALNDPSENIRFGARYLAARGRAAGVTNWNDPAQARRALAAYNGRGPMAAAYAERVFRNVEAGGQPPVAPPSVQSPPPAAPMLAPGMPDSASAMPDSDPSMPPMMPGPPDISIASPATDPRLRMTEAYRPGGTWGQGAVVPPMFNDVPGVTVDPNTGVIDSGPMAGGVDMTAPGALPDFSQQQTPQGSAVTAELMRRGTITGQAPAPAAPAPQAAPSTGPALPPPRPANPAMQPAPAAAPSTGPGLPPPMPANPAMQQQPQTGGIYAPVIRELVNTPGGGAAALRLVQSGEAERRQDSRFATAERDRNARFAFTALGRGDIQAAQAFAERAGFQISPDLMRNPQQARLLSAASLTAERIYGNHEDQAAVFIQAYIQSNGNVQAAFEAAGVPRSRPRFSLPWAMAEDGRTQQLLRVNQDTGEAEPVMMNGAPVTRAAPGAGGAAGGVRPLDRQVKLEMLMAAGVDDQTANLMAAGGTVTPSTLASIAQRVQATIAREVEFLGNNDPARTPQARQQRFEQVMDSIYPQWRQSLGQGGGAQRPAPTQGMPQAPAMSAPPQQALAPDGQPGFFTGQRDAQGRPLYMTQTGRRFVIGD